MYTSVLMFVSYAALTRSVTVRFLAGKDIHSESRTELTPIRIPCELTDIVIISAPVAGGRHAIYHLYNPKGNFRKLDISPPSYTKNISEYDTISIKSHNETLIITATNNYKVFNVNYGICDTNTTEDIFACREKELEPNDFMIGPLITDDYGNWVISAFYRDQNNKWAEIYQVITIDIIETVAANTLHPNVKVGETFEFGFAYPIKGLETCQLVVPKSTFDRFYDTNRFKMDTCGYIVKNVTLQDAGLWRIIGVGRITYEAVVNLNVTI